MLAILVSLDGVRKGKGRYPTLAKKLYCLSHYCRESPHAEGRNLSSSRAGMRLFLPAPQHDPVKTAATTLRMQKAFSRFERSIKRFAVELAPISILSLHALIPEVKRFQHAGVDKTRLESMTCRFMHSTRRFPTTGLMVLPFRAPRAATTALTLLSFFEMMCSTVLGTVKP